MTKYVSSNAHGRPSVEFLTGGEYDAPTLELPRVAASAGYLAEWMLDRPVSDEAEAAAGTVSDFLRRLTEDTPTNEYDSPRSRIEQNIGAGCPDWCQVDHTGPRLAVERAEGMRECSIGGEEIPTLTGQTTSASVVQFTDLITGTRRAPEVRVGDDTLTPENAIALAEQIRDAAISALAPTLIGHPNRSGDCATWCVDENGSCGGECMGNPTDVLATAGYKAFTDGGGMRVGLAESYPVIRDDRPAVCVKVSGPIDAGTDKEAWVEMTPAEARQYGAAILRHADVAESA